MEALSATSRLLAHCPLTSNCKSLAHTIRLLSVQSRSPRRQLPSIQSQRTSPFLPSALKSHLSSSPLVCRPQLSSRPPFRLNIMSVSPIAVNFPRPTHIRSSHNSASDSQPSPEQETKAGSEPPKPSLWSRLGQSFNAQGVTAVASVVVTDPSLAIPHVSVPDIRWVDWPALRAAGFTAVVFDKDNTLTRPYSMEVDPALTGSLSLCRQAFGSARIAILSNSAGLKQYDPSGLHASAMESALGVPVIRHEEKKPGGGREEVERHFGCNAEEIVVVGDRCLTDIVYGNRNGCLTILTAPLASNRDPMVVQQARKFEDLLMAANKQRGFCPPAHPRLTGSAYQFVLEPACW